MVTWQHKVGNTKQLIRKTKNGAKYILLHYNLVDNQPYQSSDVLYIFTPNKFYSYLLNVEPSNLLFLKTYRTRFDDIIIFFTDQNCRPLEIEEKVI